MFKSYNDKKQGRKMRTEKDNEYSKDYEDRRGQWGQGKVLKDRMTCLDHIETKQIKNIAMKS